MSGTRVLETATGVMGAFAGQLFVQAGMTVDKIDIGQEDPMRDLGPWRDGATTSEPGGLYVALNRRKSLIALDLPSDAGRREFRSLVESADVLLFGPELEDAGITDQMLRTWNPRLIRSFMAPIAGAGPYHRYHTTPLQLLALGGIMGITGEPDREPLQIPGHHPDYLGAIHAFTATSAALLQRASVGLGERVETSAFEAVAATAEMICTLYTYTGAVRSRFHGRQPWGIQGEVMACKDGHVAVHPGAFETLALVIGRPELVDDPLFTDPMHRLTHAEDFLSLLRPYLEAHTRREIIADCEALRVPFGAVLDVADVLADEQLIARGFFEPLKWADGRLEVPGALYRTSEITHDHQQGPPDNRNHRRHQRPTDESRPLSGIRVVDLSWVWAGPSCTRILADLGADVIKIEAPHRPDSVRALVQDRNEVHPDYWNRGGYFNEKNLGKRGMTLDLAHPLGVEVFLELVESADVVVESFSPRVMGQLGLGFERLAQQRPGLVMVSLSGYGQSGPGRNRVAYGAALEPEAGVTATIGYPDGPPVKSGLAYTDPISGVVAAGAILTALRNQLQSSEVRSVHIDVAEREVLVPFITDVLMDFQLNGTMPTRVGNRHKQFWPQGCYRCAGQDRWLTITVVTDEQWRALAAQIGAHHLMEVSTDERRQRATEIDQLLSEFCAQRDAFATADMLQSYGVPAAVVQSGRDIYFDEHLRAREFFTAVDHPVVGVKEYHRFLGATFESLTCRPERPAPLLDEHSVEVLHELGRQPEEIEELRKLGVWGHQLIEGSRRNLSLPLEQLLAIGAISRIDPVPAPTIAAGRVMGK